MAILIRKIHEDECDEVSDLLEIAGWRISPEGLYTSNPASTTLVLIEGNEIIGTLGIRDYRRICNVMVLPEYRGLHYGFLLMEASKGYVKGNPYLYVKMFNWKAIKLYLMEGYKIVGIRKKSWKMEKGND